MLGSTTVTVVDPGTGQTSQKTFAAAATPFSIALNTVFISDGSALVINLNLDLHRSVGIDSNGNLNFNPFFLIAHGRLTGPPPGMPPNPFTGGVERTLGTI